MTQALTDLTAAVNAAIAEMATLVSQLQTALANGDDAQVEVLAQQLNTAVTSTQASLAPAVVVAPATTQTAAAGVAASKSTPA